MYFKASYDKLTKVVTPAVIMLVAASCVPLFLTFLQDTGWWLIIIPVLILLSLAISAAYAPKSYTIDGGQVCINRLFATPVRIPENNILSIEALSKSELKGSLRVFGSGAFFGYYGKFYNRSFGKMTWYATNLQNALLIHTNDNKKYLITPDDKGLFIKSLKKRP